MNTLFNNTVYMDVGLMIIYLGMAGLLLNQSNIIISIISIEILFYGINYYLITVSTLLQDIQGLIISIFVLTSAAGESAIALSLLMVYFKIFKNILL